MAEPAQVTVVIPAFNEQEAIADVVGRVRGPASAGQPYEQG